MNKINMKSVLDILGEKEMKNVMGGSGGSGSEMCCEWSCNSANNKGSASSNDDCWTNAEKFCPSWDGFLIVNHC